MTTSCLYQASSIFAFRHHHQIRPSVPLILSDLKAVATSRRHRLFLLNLVINQVSDQIASKLIESASHLHSMQLNTIALPLSGFPHCQYFSPLAQLLRRQAWYHKLYLVKMGETNGDVAAEIAVIEYLARKAIKAKKVCDADCI
jgi:hypothetical protein